MSLLQELETAVKYFSYASTAGDHSMAVANAAYVLNQIPQHTKLTPQERQLVLDLAYEVGDYNLIKKLRQQENE